MNPIVFAAHFKKVENRVLHNPSLSRPLLCRSVAAGVRNRCPTSSARTRHRRFLSRRSRLRRAEALSARICLHRQNRSFEPAPVVTSVEVIKDWPAAEQDRKENEIASVERAILQSYSRSDAVYHAASKHRPRVTQDTLAPYMMILATASSRHS
jgi:hypothetical protein